ncbi:hypothetical protein ACX3V1_27995, partial [Escherichia coli]
RCLVGSEMCIRDRYAKQQAEIQTLRNQLRDILGAALSGKEVN